MLRKCIRLIWWVLNGWAILCVVAFLSGIIVSFVGAPRWLPLPWSDFTDFVEGTDGKVYVDIGFYSRILSYGPKGEFIASYPYPSGHGKDTGLAASVDGRLFFRTMLYLYVCDNTWQKQYEFRGNSRRGRNWVLDEDGNLLYVAGGKRDVAVVNRLAKPGDRIFAKEHRRQSFECSDGSTLLREGNSLKRYSVDGTLLTTYQAPAILRPFTFLWPAFWAWPYLMLYGIVSGRRKRIGQQCLQGDA